MAKTQAKSPMSPRGSHALQVSEAVGIVCLSAQNRLTGSRDT